MRTLFLALASKRETKNDHQKVYPAPNEDLRVHEIKEGDEVVAYVTVYKRGPVVFEFDSDKRYTTAELEEILKLGKTCHL